MGQDWVGSLGGPLMLVPESALLQWGGTPPTYPDDDGDYGRGCAVDGYLARVGRDSAPRDRPAVAGYWSSRPSPAMAAGAGSRGSLR
jgi:hypothetical protein